MHEFRLSNLRQKALGEEVSETLRAAILEGQLPPGARLVEVDLAEELGVSRGPVRDALRRLEADRLVVSTPRKGSSVAVFSRQDVEEIYSLRAALEGVGARWLTSRLSDDAYSRLYDALEKMSIRASESASWASLMESDLEFHRLLAELSGHGRLYDAWKHIQPQIQFIMHTMPDVYEDTNEVIGWHESMLQALRSGDGAAAEATIRSHIEDAAERILRQWPKSEVAE